MTDVIGRSDDGAAVPLDAKVDAARRYVILTRRHLLDVKPVTLTISFKDVKALAATILEIEVEREDAAMKLKRPS